MSRSSIDSFVIHETKLNFNRMIELGKANLCISVGNLFVESDSEMKMFSLKTKIALGLKKQMMKNGFIYNIEREKVTIGDILAILEENKCS